VTATATGGNGNVHRHLQQYGDGWQRRDRIGGGTGTVTVTANNTVTGTTARRRQRDVSVDGPSGHGTGNIVGQTNGCERDRQRSGHCRHHGSGSATGTTGDGIIASSNTGLVIGQSDGHGHRGAKRHQCYFDGGANVSVTGVGAVTADDGYGHHRQRDRRQRQLAWLRRAPR
jgi:hypothetical protein